MEASGNELLLEVQIEGETLQFLIDSRASLSFVKRGVSRAEVRPTDLAARGITGTKLKTTGTQEIKLRLGNRIYTVSQVECARLRGGVPYVEVYIYNPKHLSEVERLRK